MKQKFYLESEIGFVEPLKSKQFKDLTGKKFTKLTVLGYAGRDIRNQAMWYCKCDCGKIVKVRGGHLPNKNTSSCGCLQVEKVSEANKIHGHSITGNLSKEYQTWLAMIQRCQNPKNQSYSDYGGRGITVCDRWLILSNFLEDMGKRPDGLTLERRENDKGYSKENCYWATRKEQQNNRRVNKFIHYNGEVKTISQWAEIAEINPRTLRNRIFRDSWPIEKALTIKVKHNYS